MSKGHDATLGIIIRYDIEADKAEIRTNVKREKVADLLGEYLHTIVGEGKDTAPSEEREVYEISLMLDLANDAWSTKHDCGNKGLREGIIMAVLALLRDRPGKVEWTS